MYYYWFVFEAIILAVVLYYLLPEIGRRPLKHQRIVFWGFSLLVAAYLMQDLLYAIGVMK